MIMILRIAYNRMPQVRCMSAYLVPSASPDADAYKADKFLSAHWSKNTVGENFEICPGLHAIIRYLSSRLPHIFAYKRLVRFLQAWLHPAVQQAHIVALDGAHRKLKAQVII